jgi:hypothetical protein
VIGKHAPPSPIFPSPLQWGDAAVVRQRFGTAVRDLTITPCMYPLEFPFPPARVVDFFFEYYGPANRAYQSSSQDARPALRDELTALWTRNNVGPEGTTLVSSEYVEVIGTRI